MKSQISKLKPIVIRYRNFKRFDEQTFVADVKNADFCFETDDPNENYSALINIFSIIVEKHVRLKDKTVRGNHLHKKKTENKIYKNPSEINEKYTKDCAINVFQSGKINKTIFI